MGGLEIGRTGRQELMAMQHMTLLMDLRSGHLTGMELVWELDPVGSLGDLQGPIGFSSIGEPCSECV